MAVDEVLSDEESYLYAILQDQSGLDLAEFSWFEADLTDGCFRAWPFQWKWWRDTSPLQIDQCFPAGTLVLTERGQVPIEEVEIGDRVLTHKSRWKAVTYRWDRGEQETVVLKGYGHPGLAVTPDHKFSLPDGTWDAPSVGSLWGSPALFPTAAVPCLPLRTYAPGRPSNIPADIESAEFLWLYGLYLAEGSCSSSFGRNGTLNRTTFSVHADEVAKVESALLAAGIRFNAQQVAGEACFNIVVNSRPLAEWFTEHGGKGAHHKTVASWALGLSKPLRGAILDGAMFGDGYIARNEYTTVSRSLAVGIRLLGQSLGYSASCRRLSGRTSTINGRELVGGDQYVVGLSRAGKVARLGDDHWWGRVKTREVGPRSRCYDIEVEDDHSFVAEGIVVSNCARSIGKTLGIQARAFVFPYRFPGQEMVVTAPELVHLEPITGLIERRFYDTRLGREIMPHGRSAVTHRPFQMNFLTGSRIIGRIPQLSGKGVKGVHPVSLELDEAQDYPDDGWTELIETLKRGTEGATWHAHGVTRGIRDKFYEFTQEGPDNHWKIHRITAIHRPGWTDEERQEKIRMYGSRDAPDYRRNVLGQHGDQTNPLFVLHRLMRCVDSIEASSYNTDEFAFFSIKAEVLEEMAGASQEDQELSLIQLLDFPEIHHRYDITWCGMDVGFTTDPSEILVFAEYTPTPAEIRLDEVSKRAVPEKGQTRLKLLTRINLQRISNPLQARVIEWVIDFYKPRAFGMDKTGNGLGLFQDLQAKSLSMAKVVKGYNFSEKVIVDIDGTVTIGDREDVLVEAAIKSNVLERSTDVLRELVDHARLQLPWNRDLIREFQGQTWCTDGVTEILTKRGWMTYDQVRVGDETLGLVDDGGTPKSRWTTINAVHVFPAEERVLVSMDGQTHHSVTTMDHRWLVKPYNHAKYLTWKTTEDLCGDVRDYRIPLATQRNDLPEGSGYSDAFVELVAWLYTEGTMMLGGKVGFCQSPSANPQLVERIEALLVGLLGQGDYDVGRGHPGRGRWSRTSASSARDAGHLGKSVHVYRIKDLALCSALRAAMTTEKAVLPEFLTRLTAHQLDIFIGTSLDADGCTFTRRRPGRGETLVRSFKQNSEARIRSFEMACALRGLPTHTRYVPTQGGWLTSILNRRYVHTTSLKREKQVANGIVWCPTTGTGTWLARSEGAVFFTGNSYSKAAMDSYGRRRRIFSGGNFHALDAARMAAFAHAQFGIEAFVEDQKHHKQEAVLDLFVGAW